MFQQQRAPLRDIDCERSQPEPEPLFETQAAGNAAAAALPPPAPPPDDGILGEAARQLSRALGMPVPELHLGSDGRRRAAAAGTIGLMDGGALFLDNSAPDRERVLAHEMVHAAQRRLAGAGAVAAAEEEAHRLAEEWVRTGQMSAPCVPLGPGAVAWELPEGRDMAWQGSGVIAARLSWLVARGLDPRAGGLAPEASRAFLEEALASPSYGWLASQPAERHQRFIDETVYRRMEVPAGQDPIVPVVVGRSLDQAFGLPPGTMFRWTVEPTIAWLTVDTDAVQVGGRLHLSAALWQEALDELARLTGLPPGTFPQGGTDLGETDSQAVVIPVRKTWLVEHFGEAWQAFPGSARQAGQGEQDSEGQGPGPQPNVRFAEGISEEDQAFARRFARRLPSGGGAELPVIDQRMIDVWRRIDSHPLEQRILHRLEHPGPQDERLPPTPDAYSELVRQVEEAYRDELRAELERGMRREGPLLDERVEGTIINAGGRLFAGQQVPFYFEVRHTPQGDSIRFPVPWARVRWTSHSTDGTAIDEGSTAHQDLFGVPPDTWRTTFPRPGQYVVRAEVQHTFFQPWAFEQYVQVESEETRRQEQEASTFGGGPFSSVQTRRATTFGDDEDDRGQFLTGTLPEDWLAPDGTCAETSRPTYAQQSASLRDRVAMLDAMAEDESVAESLRSGAAERAAELRETLSAQEAERGRGAQFFSIQASYLGRMAEASSRSLELMASARRVEEGVQVTLWDQSQAYDTRAHTFEATGESFHGAFRQAAYDLAKAYPSGRMSVRGEHLDEALSPTGRWIGWELECNSDWEEVRRSVWDPVTQIAVNVAATAAMVFLPETAVVILPMLLAYNTADTVATLWQLQASGALEASDVAVGVGNLLADIVPVAGRAARLGRTAMAVLEVAEFGADLLLLSVDAEIALREINRQLVDELVPLHRQIVELERTNPSDPQLDALRQDFERRRALAASRASSQIQEMIATRALLFAAGHAASEIRGGDPGESVALDTDAEIDLLRRRFDPTQPVPREALPDIQHALGLPVHPELVDGGDVHLHFRRNADGTLGDILMSIGREATLETALQHVHSVRAMRRYRGVAGILRNTLDDLRTWLRTGHTLSDGGREAMFELEKLEPAVEALNAHLESTPMTDETRRRLEAERDSLREQIELQRTRLNSTDPGIGVVASHQDASDVGTATPHQLATGSEVIAPLFDAQGRFHNALLEQAYGRYVDSRPPGAQPLPREDWIDHVGSSPELSRILEEELGPSWRQRRATGEILHEAVAGPTTTWEIPEGPERDRLDEIAMWREFFRNQRDAVPAPESGSQLAPEERAQLLARMQELTERIVDDEGWSVGGPRADLTPEEWQEFDQIDLRLRQDGFLRQARGGVNHASEQVGTLGADLYMRDQGRSRVWPTDVQEAGEPGTVDGIYRSGDQWWILEAKGNGAGLGSRRIEGERFQQGHPVYLQRTLEDMRAEVGNDRINELLQAWREGRLHYVQATTPLVSVGESVAGMPEMGARQVHVREFDIGGQPPGDGQTGS